MSESVASASRRRSARRSARRERQAARLLGTTRVTDRPRYEPAPDCAPVTLPSGMVLALEVKTRQRLPVLLTSALEQAAAYGPTGCVPVAVLSAFGEEPLIVLPLRAFRLIAGIAQPAATNQLTLDFTPKTPSPPNDDTP